MTNSTPPGQRPPRLRDDEPIALLVAFLAFGGIFFWALSQGRQGFDLASWFSQPTQTGSTSILPGLDASPSPTGTATIAPPATDVQGGPRITAVPTASPTPPFMALPSPSPTQTVAPASPPLKAAIAFPDVSNTYWAYPFIAALSARGIVGGFPDGNFRPNEPVTRGQFAIQLQKAFAKPDQLPPKQFPDVPSTYAEAVDKAVKSNFMSGYPDGTFRPEQQVSRLEAIIAMVRGLNTQLPADPEPVLQAFPDNADVPYWARQRMAAAVQAGLYSGDPNTKLLQPNTAANRADVAALVYKGLETTGQIAK